MSVLRLACMFISVLPRSVEVVVEFRVGAVTAFSCQNTFCALLVFSIGYTFANTFIQTLKRFIVEVFIFMLSK